MMIVHWTVPLLIFFAQYPRHKVFCHCSLPPDRYFLLLFRPSSANPRTSEYHLQWSCSFAPPYDISALLCVAVTNLPPARFVKSLASVPRRIVRALLRVPTENPSVSSLPRFSLFIRLPPFRLSPHCGKESSLFVPSFRGFFRRVPATLCRLLSAMLYVCIGFYSCFFVHFKHFLFVSFFLYLYYTTKF